MQKWKIRSSKTLLKIEPWLEVRCESVQLPSGRKIDDYHRIVLPEYAMIAGITVDGFIITERMYRHGSRGVTLSLPSGYLNEGEDPLIGAKRELREETGYISKKWASLGSFWVDGNRECGKAHFFLALDCEKVYEPESFDLEEIDVQKMKIEEMINAIVSGDVLEMVTVAALGLVCIELEKWNKL